MVGKYVDTLPKDCGFITKIWIFVLYTQKEMNNDKTLIYKKSRTKSLEIYKMGDIRKIWKKNITAS